MAAGILFSADAKIFHLINGCWANPLFDIIMPVISEIGSGEMLFALSASLFVLRRRKGGGRLALLLFAGLTVTYYAVYVIKTFAARPRPPAVLPDVNLMIAEKGFSFPSNHSTQAFMAATILSDAFRSMRLPLFIAAAMVGYSRIYMGVHFFSDVACGAILGTAIGYGILRMAGPAGMPESR